MPAVFSGVRLWEKAPGQVGQQKAYRGNTAGTGCKSPLSQREASGLRKDLKTNGREDAQWHSSWMYDMLISTLQAAVR